MTNINYNEIAESFVQFFHDREFSNVNQKTKLFNNVESDIWWMSGDENVYSFSGEKFIKHRMDNLFPIVEGFNNWSFVAKEIIVDQLKNKIMLEIDVEGFGYGDKTYTNNYLFILSINEHGKINLIREYLDANSVVQYSLACGKIKL